MRATLEERLNEAEQRIRSPEFRKKSNVGAEFGYYIFTYPAEKELEVRERVEQMKKQIEADVLDFNLYVFDVFEIFVEFLKNNGYLEKSFSFEKKRQVSEIETRRGKFVSREYSFATRPRLRFLRSGRLGRPVDGNRKNLSASSFA